MGGFRFLAAVKLVTICNYFFSILFFYLLLRQIKLSKITALIFTFLLFTHRQNITGVGAASLNMPGLWALIAPIYFFLVLRSRQNVISNILFGVSLALSYLQNPYYGFFVSIFLSLPVILYLFKLTQFRTRFSLLFLSFLAFIALVLPLKGFDIYKNFKNRPDDPEGRNYILRQVRTYRPWYHLITPGGHFLENTINQPILGFIHFLIDKEKVDLLLLWFPDASNQSYLGLINIFGFMILAVIFVVRRKSSLSSIVPYILTLLIGAAVCFRADAFFGSRHITFPWYRLQVLLPFTSLHYYEIFVVIIFYLSLAFLFEKVFMDNISKLNSKTLRFIVIISIMLLALASLYDTAYAGKSEPCYPKEDKPLAQYLQTNKSKRIFLQLPGKCDLQFNPTRLNDQLLNQELGWDARFYQIFNNAPIYAKDSLSWLDNYRYDPPLKDLRNLNTILTDSNNETLKKMDVSEIVLYTEFVDANTYWSSFLKPIFKSTKQVKIFSESIVFTLN